MDDTNILDNIGWFIGSVTIYGFLNFVLKKLDNFFR